MQNVWYTGYQVSLYLWQIKVALKHSKFPKIITKVAAWVRNQGIHSTLIAYRTCSSAGASYECPIKIELTTFSILLSFWRIWSSSNLKKSNCSQVEKLIHQFFVLQDMGSCSEHVSKLKNVFECFKVDDNG